MKIGSPGVVVPRHLLVMAGAFLIFLCVLLPGTRHNVYYHGEFLFIQQAQRVSSNPLAAFQPNYGMRCHPFYMFFLFLENLLFGLEPLPYFAVMFSLHGINAFFVMRLCRVLGGDDQTQLFSGLLFLFSSAFSTTLIAIHVTIRILCLFLFLLATFSWLEFLARRSPFSFLKTAFFQILAQMTMEDAMVFPILMGFLGIRRTRVREVRERFWVGPLLLLFLADMLLGFVLVRPFLLSEHRGLKVSANASLPLNLATLLLQLVGPLFVPYKGLLPARPFPEHWMWLLPFFLFLVLGAVFLRKGERRNFLFQGISKPLVLVGLGWIGITAFPFLLHPDNFAHGNRLMYFPMVGFCMIWATGAAGFLNTAQHFSLRWAQLFCWTTIVYTLSINLLNTKCLYLEYQRYMEKHHLDKEYFELRQKCLDKGS